MGKLVLIPLVMIGLFLGALAWSRGGVEKRAEFSFINRGDIITLDLNQMSYMQDFRLSYGIREGLCSVHPQTLRPIPAGATHHEVSPDSRIWTFHLRPDSKWSNGDKITAHDYVFSWKRFLEEPGEYTYLFYYINNAKAYEDSYTKGAPIDFKTVGVEALDDLTFKITLTDPVPFLIELTAFPPFYPRHERSMLSFRVFENDELFEKVDAVIRREFKDLGGVAKLTMDELFAKLPTIIPSNGFTSEEKSALSAMLNSRCIKYAFRAQYTRPPDVVTNGPFNLVRWDFKRRLTLHRSPTYWDVANVKLDSIEMVVDDNPLSQFLQYEAKQVEWLSDVAPDVAAELRKKGRSDLRTAPAFGTAFLTFMCTENLPPTVGGGKNPLHDVRVRQALAMSIDKKFIVDNVTRMGELPARTYVPPDGTLDGFTWLPGPNGSRKEPYTDAQLRELLLQPWNDEGPGLPFNIAKAKQLLAEAGYPNGQGFPTLPIVYNADSVPRKGITLALKDQWKKNLNIDVAINPLELKIYRDRVSKKEYAIGCVAWYGDYPDASTFTDKYLSTSIQNDAVYNSKEYDDLCFQATKEGDAAKRLDLLRKAAYKLDTEVPIVPIYHYVNIQMSRENVQGVKPNGRNITIFKGISMSK